MAAPTEAQLAHQALLDDIDIHSIPKSFRSSSWRPNHRRNKNVKTIMIDASRKEAAASSAAPTPQDASGAATPSGGKDDGLSTSGTSTPANNENDAANGGEGEGEGGGGRQAAMPPNLAQANKSLSKLVLEKNLRQGAGAGAGTALATGTTPGGAGPVATYTNIEGAPSLAHTKHYCDVTGLSAPYLDPKTRLRYHDRETFGLIRSLPQGAAEQYLEARGAHTVLK